MFGACGGAALYRREMLDEIGGFDPSFFFALDDADVAWRAQMRGWRCLYVPAAVVHHHHGATIGHGSSLKYFHVGLNRVRTLAKNADDALLRRHALAMIGYDLAYVAYAAVTDRTLAPLGPRQGAPRMADLPPGGRAARAAGAGPGHGPQGRAGTPGRRPAPPRLKACARAGVAIRPEGSIRADRQLPERVRSCSRLEPQRRVHDLPGSPAARD